MKRTIVVTMLLLVLTASMYAQSGSINNTLSTGGAFTIKDGSTTFFSLSQSTGYLSLNKCLALPVTTSSTVGVIFKGANRFIHDYQAPGTVGYNTFVGINSGNFTMSGSGDQGSWNTAVGNGSLSSLTSGHQNSAFGSQSLFLNTTGSNNSTFGYQSLLFNSTGANNSAFGSGSLYTNTTGQFNSAFGAYSLVSNTTGNSNSAFGLSSLYSNITGNDNCAFGFYSLYSNTAGYNCAFGDYSLYYNTAGYNCAFGDYSLYSNTGSNNSAFGFGALNGNTSGGGNSALGYSAGSSLITGSNNTLLGGNAQPSTNSVSNEITLGNSSIATLRCQVTTITALSDARDKKNIRDLSLGLEFLMNVKPRLFNWDRREWYKDGKPDGTKMQATPTAGFIAQELDEVQTKEHTEWLNLVLKSNPNRLEATPGNLLPIMVKAIQELKTENDALKAEVRTLRTSIAEQVRKEVKALLTKAIQNNEASTAVTLGESTD